MPGEAPPRVSGTASVIVEKLCRLCRKLPNVYTDEGPVYCPDCCPDHDYEYDKYERAHVCNICGGLRPYEDYCEGDLF